MTGQNNFEPWMANDLLKSGILIETAEAYGIYPAADMQSYIIPYIDPKTGKAMLDAVGMPYVRKKTLYATAKYLSNKGGGIRCYIPAKSHEYYIENTKMPLLITEGEKKAIAATEKRLYTIGLGGITMWRACNGSNKIHPDLIKYFKGRKEVYLIYDSDGLNKKEFKSNSEVFAKSLKEHGIKLYTVFVPQLSKTKMGLDDFLNEYTRRELISYIEWRKVHIKPKYQTNTYGRVYFDDLREYNLKADEYLILTTIKALTRRNEYCTASREYLAGMLNITRSTIIKKLQKLQGRDLIYIKNTSKRKSPIKLTAKGGAVVKKWGGC